MSTNVTLSAVFYGLGYLMGVAAFLLIARSRRLLTDGVAALMAAALIGGLAAANLAQRIVGGTPGKTVLGAIAGGYLCVAVAKKALGIRRPLGDLFAIAISAGEAIGRWGCFFGGCCFGKPSHLPWAVWQHDAFRHPTQIYLSLANVGILIALWRFAQTKPPENGLFYLQGVLYCIARFVIEFWRETPAPLAGLSAAQWVCTVGLLFFGARLILLMRPLRKKEVSLAMS